MKQKWFADFVALYVVCKRFFSPEQTTGLVNTLEFRIEGTPRLLFFPFFATPTNLIQHSPVISFGEFCQSPLLFQTPRLLIHVHDRQKNREA